MLQVKLDLVVHKVKEVSLEDGVNQAHQVSLEHQDSQDSVVNLDWLGQLGPLDLVDKEENLARGVNQAQQAHLVQVVKLDHLASKVSYL